MKCTLKTNEYTKLTERTGEFKNPFSLTKIGLVSGASMPAADVEPMREVEGRERCGFSAPVGKNIYGIIISNEVGKECEIKVSDFPYEGKGGDADLTALENEVTDQGKQIQNCSKKLPSGTILAVDYRKGVTAQDFEGNLIEPNGIETTLGHDTGVFYNADGSFQGQRDRVKGLWNGKSANNLMKEINPNHFVFLTTQRKKDGYSNFKGVKTSGSVVLNMGIDPTTQIDDKYYINTKIRNNGLATINFTTNSLIVPNSTILPGETKIIDNVYTAFASSVGCYQIRMADNTDFDVDIWNETMYEKSPIATPYCEKNRATSKIEYPVRYDPNVDIGYFIMEFHGKRQTFNTDGNTNTDTWYAIGNVIGTGGITLNNSAIDLMTDGYNKVIINFSPTGVSGLMNKTPISGAIDIRSVVYRLCFNGRNFFEDSLNNNFVQSVILGKGRNLTAEEIELYSNSGIEIPDVGEFYSIAYSKKRTDQYGTYKRGWEITSVDTDIFEIKDKKYKISGADGVESVVVIDANGAKAGTALDQVNGYLRVNVSVVLPCDVEVL